MSKSLLDHILSEPAGVRHIGFKSSFAYVSRECRLRGITLHVQSVDGDVCYYWRD